MSLFSCESIWSVLPACRYSPTSPYQKNYPVLKFKNVWWFCEKCEKEAREKWGTVVGDEVNVDAEMEEEVKEVMLDHDYTTQGDHNNKLAWKATREMRRKKIMWRTTMKTRKI